MSRNNSRPSAGTVPRLERTGLPWRLAGAALAAARLGGCGTVEIGVATSPPPARTTAVAAHTPSAEPNMEIVVAAGITTLPDGDANSTRPCLEP